MTFDEWYLKGCYWVSEKSKDPSTKIGCILVNQNNRIISCGYNGIPKGLDDSDERLNNRTEKYKFVEHAERNCIYSAAQHGISTLNSILYINGYPCCDCTRAIISAGINKIVIHDEFYNIMLQSINGDRTWLNDLTDSSQMLLEAGIIVDFVSCKLNVNGYFRGKEYEL